MAKMNMEIRLNPDDARLLEQVIENFKLMQERIRNIEQRLNIEDARRAAQRESRKYDFPTFK